MTQIIANIRILRAGFVGMVLATAVLSSAGMTNAQESGIFELTSPAFSDNGMMAQKYAGKSPHNANCVGENVSPPLAWKNPPEGTKSFALIVFDQEGRFGLGVTHWIAYGIDGRARSLPEGAGADPSGKFVGGKNILGVNTYLGPCPQKGAGTHHYVFTLVATKLEPNALQPGLTKQELLDAIGKDAIAGTGLISRWGH